MKLEEQEWYIKKEQRNKEFFDKYKRFPNWKEYQELHNFVETDYGVKEREWKMLDYCNPGWTPAIPFGGRN